VTARALQSNAVGSMRATSSAPVCATFTEGFDTRDLIDAKALLEELR
jgi:hypothetical protein